MTLSSVFASAQRMGAETRRQRGFSLVELALALVILGLLLGGLLLPLSTSMENTARRATRAQLDQLIDTLAGFAMSYGRLPCPDSSRPADGIEDRLHDGCRARQGVLPWRTLGSTGRDAWGRHFLYVVSEHYSDGIDSGSVAPPADCRSRPSQSSFALCSEGRLRIIDGDGELVAGKVPVLVLSRGRRATAVGADEAENLDADEVFVWRDYGNRDGAPYDDLLVWLSPHLLAARMVDAGRLP